MKFKDDDIFNNLNDILLSQSKKSENDKVIRKSISKSDKDKLLGKQKNRCDHCGKELEPDICDADHVIPIWNNGPNDVVNIQLLCPECHRKKSNKESSIRSIMKGNDKEINNKDKSFNFDYLF